MIVRIALRSLLPSALPVAVALGSWAVLSPWLAVAAYAAAMAVMVATGCAIVRTTAVQRITWRNRVAGWCLPHAQVMGGGTLARVATSSLLGSAVVGGAVFGLLGLRALGAPPSWPLLGAWLLNVLSQRFLVATRTRPYLLGAPRLRRGRRLLLLAVLQLAASVALHLGDRPVPAVLVACLPQLLVLGAMVLVMVSMTTSRNARWR